MWSTIRAIFYLLFQKYKSDYNWQPDIRDARDFLYAQKFATAPLKSLVDLSATLPPVFDQGQLGACTGNALAGALSYIHPTIQNFSRLFIYRGERAIEHTLTQDSGAQIRDGIKFLSKVGCCSETSWPYDIRRFITLPPKTCFVEASSYKISQYVRLQTLDDMLQCLSAGYPFVFGFTVYDAFESSAVADSGVLNLPVPGEKVVGGHAVVAVGYDMLTRRFKVRNSWGPQFGIQGHFTIPFEYLENRNLSNDFWTVRK